MNRLTTKMENTPVGYCLDTDEIGFDDTIVDIINKMGKLEDIEEELGIDLVTLFKALKGEGYIKGKGCIGSTYGFTLALGASGACLFNSYHNRNYYRYYALEDYGKTWALTEEELANDELCHNIVPTLLYVEEIE